MPKLSLAIGFLLLILLVVQCKNIWGNPHKSPVPPRVVPVANDSLRVEPNHWWAGPPGSLIDLRFQRPGLAAFEARLVQAKGVKLLKTERSDSPDLLLLRLAIGPKAPPQKLQVVFSKEKQLFTHEFPLRNRPTGQ